MVCPSNALPHTRPTSNSSVRGRLTHLRRADSRSTCLPWALLLLAVACGGPASEGAPADSPEGAVSEDTGDAPRAEGTAEGEPVSQCTDGSCFECGSGLCPKGFYCDEDAVGGAACSWLVDCPREPNCACIARELGQGCRCEERDGGVYVSCS